MRRFIRQFDLPSPSTESVTDASLHLYGRRAAIRFDYLLDGKPRRSALLFSGVAATRSRSERCCTSTHIKSFDALIEIVDSQWVKTQCEEISEMYRAEFAVRHYSIYFDSVGCFELLAEGFEVMPEEAGAWAATSQTPTLA